MDIPASTHPHDRKWVDEQLSKLDSSIRAHITRKYDEVFKNARQERAHLFPEDVARFEANTRLRVYVQKVAGASHGQVIKPPKR